MHLKILFLCVSLIPIVSAVFTAAGIQALVDGHNAFRSQIAKGQYVQKFGTFPMAANMRKMKWDNGIAAAAQAYANTRPTWHDNGRGPVGENLYWKWEMGPTSHDSHGPKAIKMWGDEFKTLGMKSINTGNGVGAIGHATQMAWHSSFKLGCGISNWQDGRLIKTCIVCRYGGPGNYPHTDMYKRGSPASRCPSGTRADRQSGLCV